MSFPNSSFASSQRKGLAEHFVAYSDGSSRKKIIVTAIGWRIVIWLAMSLSCAMIPDHNPGNDVLRFHLVEPKFIQEEEEGQYGKQIAVDFKSCSLPFVSSEPSVAVHSVYQRISYPVFILQSKIYPFLLEPFTRWDAARFLWLAYQPNIRRPTVMDDCHQQNDDDNNMCRLHRFSSSEQTHAFLPLFPFLIRFTATMLIILVPHFLLPTTCQSLLVLSAACLNTVCFLVVTLDLYGMTRDLLLFHYHLQKNHKEDTKPVFTSHDCDKWARRVALLFVFNPANVFFATAYSEALCAALLCRGCRSALNMVLTNAATGRNCTWWTMFRTTSFWWLAALTRSNSTLYGGFLLLYGAGLVFRARYGSWTWIRRLSTASYVLFMVVLLTCGSIGWHNFRGYSLHCVEFHGEQPTWCENGPWFNLYAHVQRKYWNVGFLRYFQWKQIPNFLLATPILVLSTMATVSWVQRSWKLFDDNTKPVFHRVVSWIITSLQVFAGENCHIYPFSTPTEILQRSPYLLGFYAVLAACTILGLTIAHVQISTRLICSSCPALYWFLAGTLATPRKRFGDAVIGFCLFYTILGIIMHPNWLPWT